MLVEENSVYWRKWYSTHSIQTHVSHVTHTNSHAYKKRRRREEMGFL